MWHDPDESIPVLTEHRFRILSSDDILASAYRIHQSDVKGIIAVDQIAAVPEIGDQRVALI